MDSSAIIETYLKLFNFLIIFSLKTFEKIETISL